MGKLGNPGGEPYAVNGNPSKGSLGGDNRGDLGRNEITKKKPSFSREYGWKGHDPARSGNSMSADELRSKMRG